MDRDLVDDPRATLPPETAAENEQSVQAKLQAQEAEIKRLAGQLSRLVDGRAPPSTEDFRHARHDDELAHPRCDREDDILSIYAESIYTDGQTPSHPPSYDPDELDLDSLVQPINGPISVKQVSPAFR